MTRLPLLLLAAAGLCAGALVHPSPDSDTFELLILHNNDMHARFEQTSQLSGACTTADREAGKCYGGFPRVAHVVKEARKAAQNGQGPPVLYLNAGDTYTGTAWFTIYKWKIAAEFINALQPDAVSLGNHEFDEAVDGLVPFIRNLSTPVLAANLILDKVPELQAEANLLPSIILVKNNIKIGIIGYLTGETKYLAPKNNVEYEDEVTALKREVRKLRQEGVTLFIALGHSGFVKDLEIAKYVDGIDLVIGGHSNTFLWNNETTKEKPEIPQGPYPVEIRQNSGKVVRVVQAYAYTKYLGRLHLTINRFGNIIKCDGTPILLDESVPRDPDVVKMVEKYRSDIDRLNNVVVGTSLSTLHGEYCRLRECNIGVLITEAMINYTRATYADPEDINVAIVQGGRIRTSIEHPEKPFNLTRGDLVTVLPFTDPIVLVSMNGSILRQCLEHAIDGWRLVDSPGQFLQLTGINITYDLVRPPGSRIVSAKAVCLDCGKQLADIEDHLQYKLLMSEFLANGGDGYAMFERLDREIMSFNEVDSLIYYLARSGPVNIGYSGRITVLNQDKIANIQANFMKSELASSNAKTTSSLILFIGSVMLCLNL